jgi:hypothetical protein
LTNELAVTADTAVESSTAAIMRLIEKATMDPTFDVGKLSKLLDVKERWEANEARKAFVQARAEFKKNAPSIYKNKDVSFGKSGTSYSHATLDSICNLLAAPLSDNGLSHSWSTEQIDGGIIRVSCVLTHIQGHSESVTLSAGADSSGSKNNIQAIGSTVTYLERYTLLAALGLATMDQDNDGIGSGSPPISVDQKNELIALIKETGTDTAKFLQFLDMPTLDQLPSNQFKRAKTALEQKRK